MTYRNHDEFMAKTPVAVNRLMQAEAYRIAWSRLPPEAYRIAWSRLPLWKRAWLKTKRYFDLNDSYPFPDAVAYRKRDKILMFLTISISIGIAIVIGYAIYWTIVVLTIIDSIGAF